ncbi:unnamed protein product [Staurois parvus]|uniref:Ribosomal protein L32 n=1 Tax=Staurois parvus TaxID=386267 RepID=A0ABN9HA22_9NEOB|nr:unnamed protein product [Staurois parvus]
MVNKYHQNKVLSVSQNAKKFIWVQCCMTAQLSFKSVIALKAENWPGQGGGKSVRT